MNKYINKKKTKYCYPHYAKRKGQVLEEEVK